MATVYGEQTDPRFAPVGVLGGTDGAPTRIAIFGPDGKQLDVPKKVTLELQPGSVIRVETSGGGGFGDPAKRDPDHRRADEEDGRIRHAPRASSRSR
jgi:N-methylhydantoinase B